MKFKKSHESNESYVSHESNELHGSHNAHEAIISNSPEETIAIGERLAKNLLPGDVITLNGDLGAGKTALTQGIAKGLGVLDYVTSPTFTIMNILEGRMPFYHFDVYRIRSVDEMEEIGFCEFLYGDGVCVIEWADLIAELLPKNRIDIRIFRMDDNVRRIEITGHNKWIAGIY